MVIEGHDGELEIVATLHAAGDSEAEAQELLAAIDVEIDVSDERLAVLAAYPVDDHHSFFYQGNRDGEGLPMWLGSSRTTVRYQGTRVMVTNSPRGAAAVWVDFVVRVPPNVRVEVSNIVGHIEATGVPGALEASSASGDINVAGGTGGLVLDTGSGDIFVSAYEGDVRPTRGPAMSSSNRWPVACGRTPAPETSISATLSAPRSPLVRARVTSRSRTLPDRSRATRDRAT